MLDYKKNRLDYGEQLIPPTGYRLKRAVAHAEKRGVLLLLENLNGEPERAEVHYMPDTLEDTVRYFAQIPSPNLKWAFTINHAHYDPVGIAGFIDGMDSDNPAQVPSRTPGRFQTAPGTYAHQLRTSRRSTGPADLWKTSDPGTSRAGSASG